MNIFTIVFGALGVYALRAPYTVAIYVMVYTTLFGTAAALFLPGGQAILVAHFFLMFLALRTIMKVGVKVMLEAIVPFRPGFFLTLFVFYGFVSVFVVLRLMEGGTYVYVLDTSKEIGEYVLRSLHPSGSNFNQLVYMVGNLVAFVCAYTLFRIPGAYFHARNALIILAIMNIGMAVLDLATWVTGTADLLSFMKNSNFALLDKDELGGFKRISGSFSEASAFAGFTSRLFVVCFTLWLYRVGPRLTGTLTIIMFGLLLFSTSTTAYIGIFVGIGVVTGPDLLRFVRGSGRSRGHFFLGAVLVIGALVGLILMVMPAAFDPLIHVIDTTLFNKLDSASGIERGSWNEQAFRIFLDTYGLGAGVGSTRTSSSFLALLSNVGVIGTVFYSGFVFTALWVRYSPALSPDERFVVRACRNGIVVAVTAQLFTAGTIDIGIINAMLFGLSASAGATRLHLRRGPAALRSGALPRPAPGRASVARRDETAGSGLSS